MTTSRTSSGTRRRRRPSRRGRRMRRSIGIWTPGARRSGRSRSTRRRSANGSHSLAWGVTDSAGRVEGIGSRNFVVLNSGADVAPADQLQTSNFELLTSERTDTRQRALDELGRGAGDGARASASSLAGLPVATGAGLGPDGLRSGDGARAGAGGRGRRAAHRDSGTRAIGADTAGTTARGERACERRSAIERGWGPAISI